MMMMNFAGGRMDISMEFYASGFGEKYSSVSSINHPNSSLSMENESQKIRFCQSDEVK